MPPLCLGDYFSPLVLALLVFGFFKVIVTFTLSTVSLLLTASAKSCKAFVMFSITLSPFRKWSALRSFCIYYTTESVVCQGLFEKKFENFKYFLHKKMPPDLDPRAFCCLYSSRGLQCYLSIGANDFSSKNVFHPFRTEFDNIPLRNRSVELNARQAYTISERTITDARHALGNHDAR